MINQLSIYFIKIIKIIKCYKTSKIFIKIYCNIIKIKKIGNKGGGAWPLSTPPPTLRGAPRHKNFIFLAIGPLKNPKKFFLN